MPTIRRREKTYVFSNLAISLDGKISPVDRALYSLGTKHDLRWLRELRNDADVVVMGASTLRAFRRPCLPSKERPLFANAVITENGAGLDPTWEFFTRPGLERFVFHTGKLPRELADRLMLTCHLVPVRKSKPLADEVIRELSLLGLNRILVEGGGGIVWEFARADRIDDYYVTLTPKLLGGREAPSLVGGAGFRAGHELDLKLAGVRRVKDELYLHYRPARKKTKSTPKGTKR